MRNASLCISLGATLLGLGCSSGGGTGLALDGGSAQSGPPESTSRGGASPATGPSPKDPTSPDPKPGLTGEVKIINVSFAGKLASGELTYVIENGTKHRFEAISELRIATTSGDLVYTQPCSKVVAYGQLDVRSGERSQVLRIKLESPAGSETYVNMNIAATFSCGASPTKLAPDGESDTFAPSSTLPTTLSLKGIFDDGSKWSASADVE